MTSEDELGEREEVKYKDKIYALNRPYDEKETQDFLFLMGRLLSLPDKRKGKQVFKPFPTLKIGGVGCFESFTTGRTDLQEQIVTMDAACSDMVGKRRSTKLHFRLTYQYEGVRYFIQHRISNMATMLARVLYSLEITSHHVKRADLDTDQLAVLQWQDDNGKILSLTQSIWERQNIENHPEWPLKTGRVSLYHKLCK